MHEVHEHAESGRTVYRPLDKLECATCGAAHTTQKKLHICEACGEAAYCSPECQQHDWREHKKHCGKNKTDRVQLESFYPLLAVIAYSARQLSVSNHDHPATRHQIINNPDPTTGIVVTCPNGEPARLVILGDSIPLSDVGSKKWWPSAASDNIRGKLFRRIVTEGNLLPLLLALTVSLMGEMYTSTALRSTEAPWYQACQRRVRLTYRKSPIADFGIVAGSTKVIGEDRLAYYYANTGKFVMGQDPKDHYWLYFTTLSGEEVYLDCGMYTFNMAVMVQSTPYLVHGMPDGGPSPAVWQDREADKYMPAEARAKIQWMPRKRFSILRDKRLDPILRDFEIADDNMPVLFNIMNEIAGRKCTEWEKMMLTLFVDFSSDILHKTMWDCDYLKFPPKPAIGIDTDPDEPDFTQDSEDMKVNAEYLGKLSRQLKHHRITVDQWVEAYRKWSDAPLEARKKILKKMK